MKYRWFLLFLSIFFQVDLMAQQLAKPSAIQYKWHEQERIMFVCLDPCTWQGREYDDHSMPLERINPSKLDTDQWCETAQLWGAKELLFVAKHTGGFCWWQTETTDYGIKDTPYKNGKGDVLGELSKSCKKYGLNLGIYVYPGDDTWGAGIGSGGRTKDPSKQEAYNKVFRQQLKEVLVNYGDVLEVWFDGSCIIDVSDILEKYAKNAVVFQGPHATLRWPGTESGRLFYPVWNAINSEDLASGVATQVHGDPDGDKWAPLETNTTLYDHFWFWSPKGEKKRKSLDHIMDCYYKSVGYGSVFLLNSTPDTTGLIPKDDVVFYKAFGDEINRRFGNPIASLNDLEKEEIILDMGKSQLINHTIIMEDYREGQRIRKYTIEGMVDGQWIELCKGESVGRMKIDYFPEKKFSHLKLNMIKSIGTPKIRKFSTHYVEDFSPPKKSSIRPYSAWQEIDQWKIEQKKTTIQTDLTGKVKIPGQYSLAIEAHSPDEKIRISEVKMYYDGNPVMNKFITVKGERIQINRTDQVTDESKILLSFTINGTSNSSGVVKFKPELIY